MKKYEHFMSQIPGEIMHKTDKQLYDNVALFKPSVFVAGKTMYSSDYHVIIPSVTPPDTYINNTFQKFDAGKIIIVNPGESIRTTKSKSTKPYLSLLIKPELMNKIANEMDLAESINFIKPQNPYSKELIQALISFDYESHRPDKSTLMLDCLATQITAILLREFKINKKNSRYLPDSDSYVSVAIDYMSTFYSSNITIGDICSEVNVSTFHFIRTFKKKTGLTPHQYLLNLRIRKAQELLEAGKFTIKEIATLCGFISLPHFSGTFKTITGYPPTEYKKNFFIGK